MYQQPEFPKVDRVKLHPVTDLIIQQVDKTQPILPEQLIKEILVETGFQSQDANTFRLIAHMTDKWLLEITDSIVSKKQGTERRKKDQEIKIQISTQEIVSELEQRGVKSSNFEHPQVDPQLLTTNSIQNSLQK